MTEQEKIKKIYKKKAEKLIKFNKAYFQKDNPTVSDFEFDQLKGQLQQAEETIKSLKGDLQTRDRESVNLRKKAEMAKFDSGLDKIKNKADAAGTIFEKRLDDTISTVKSQLADRLKDKGSPSSGKKQSKGKGKK